MQLKMVTGLLCASMLACVPGNNPLRITATNPLDTACKVEDMLSITRGSLDASGAGTYIINLHVISELETTQPITDENGNALNGPGVNNFIVEGLALTYSAKNPTITFEPETLPLFGVIAAGGKSDFWGTIIGPKAAQKLRDAVNDVTFKTSFVVNIAIKGHLESGESMEANPIAFPIDVFTTLASCTNGYAPTGPCGSGGGQDGAVVTCL